ncbi:hypothetical protein MgSA37_03803 [Mucilaginibacter gotjawali]|nr:hypothetical protein MgSA37_03803 [Mucilaginibacter gotjawali]
MYTDKLVIDTYIQENNRYKNNLMEISETFFNNDSVTVLKFISLLDDQNSEFYRIIFGMRGIDMFLNDFNFSSLDKHKFFKLQVEAFSKEFSSSSQVRSSLNQKYKMQEKKISLHMDSAFDVQNAIDEPAELLNIRSKLNIKYIGIIMDEFEQNKNDQEFLSFLSSHIHMFINRLFIAKQRKYELLIYSFLERFYSSNLARARTYDS